MELETSPLLFTFPEVEELSIKEIVTKLFVRRLEQKKNTVVYIVGDLGEGKSYTALKLASLIDDDLNVQEQVIYDARILLETLNRFKNSPKRCIILDETHVTLPAREWQSLANKAVNYVLTTFRQIKAVCLFIVAPQISLIDKVLRALGNYYIVCRRYSNSFVRATIYAIEKDYLDIEKTKIHLIHPKISYKGKLIKIKGFLLKMPREEIVEEYEKHAVTMKSRILEEELRNIVGYLSYLPPE